MHFHNMYYIFEKENSPGKKKVLRLSGIDPILVNHTKYYRSSQDFDKIVLTADVNFACNEVAVGAFRKLNNILDILPTLRSLKISKLEMGFSFGEFGISDDALFNIRKNLENFLPHFRLTRASNTYYKFEFPIPVEQRKRFSGLLLCTILHILKFCFLTVYPNKVFDDDVKFKNAVLSNLIYGERIGTSLLYYMMAEHNLNIFNVFNEIYSYKVEGQTEKFMCIIKRPPFYYREFIKYLKLCNMRYLDVKEFFS